MRSLWATIYEIICSTGRVEKFLNYIKPKNTPYIALCRTYAERCGRASRATEIKTGGGKGFAFFVPAILYMQMWAML